LEFVHRIPNSYAPAGRLLIHTDSGVPRYIPTLAGKSNADSRLDFFEVLDVLFPHIRLCDHLGHPLRPVSWSVFLPGPGFVHVNFLCPVSRSASSQRLASCSSPIGVSWRAALSAACQGVVPENRLVSSPLVSRSAKFRLSSLRPIFSAVVRVPRATV